jgi:hypothetical protein
MARLDSISENRRKTALLDSLMPTAIDAPRVGMGGRGTPRSTGGAASDPVAVAALMVPRSHTRDLRTHG